MSVAVIGKQRSYEFRWRRWALLRDTIDTIAAPSQFPRLHELGSSERSSVRLPAAELASEVNEVVRLLRGRTTLALAISPQTAAVLYLGVMLSEPRPLTRFERKQMALDDEEDLAQYFSSMCASILEVCEQPLDDGTVEVIHV